MADIQYVKLNDLLPCPYNREISREKIDSIIEAVGNTGTIKPFVVTEVKTDNGDKLMITDGHHRWLALKEMNLSDECGGEMNPDLEVPVVMADERGVDTAVKIKPQEVLKGLLEILPLMKQVIEAPVSGLALVRENLEPERKKKDKTNE